MTKLKEWPFPHAVQREREVALRQGGLNLAGTAKSCEAAVKRGNFASHPSNRENDDRFLGHLTSRNEGTAKGLLVYADGCCEPNPGIGGWAFAVYRDGEEVASDIGGLDPTTNNQMELTALLRAVEWIADSAPGEAATIVSDSRYVVDGCNLWRHSWRAKGWKRKGVNARPDNQAVANLELWQAIDAALTAQPLISIKWCKGHAGIPGNVRADELASIGRATVIDANEVPSDLDRQYRAIMGEPSWI